MENLYTQNTCKNVDGIEGWWPCEVPVAEMAGY